MTKTLSKTKFKAILLQPAEANNDLPHAFVLLPKIASEKLSRRGRITVAASINGYSFNVMLEPDGQLSHWMPISKKILAAAKTQIGEVAEIEISTLAQEPEPETPVDFKKALAANAGASAMWQETTTIARVDWIHWICSAKQAKTRAQRINNACEMLASGKKRVCCFDPSGFYSKALRAPAAAE